MPSLILNLKAKAQQEGANLNKYLSSDLEKIYSLHLPVSAGGSPPRHHTVTQEMSILHCTFCPCSFCALPGPSSPHKHLELSWHGRRLGSPRLHLGSDR